MKDNHIEVIEAKEGLARAKENLFDVYIEEIKKRSLTCSDNVQQKIIRSLESLLKSPTVDGFDFNKARKIRIREGLTQAELGKELGIGQNTLSMYERGKILRIDGELFSRYLTWLKKQGYDKLD